MGGGGGTGSGATINRLRWRILEYQVKIHRGGSVYQSILFLGLKKLFYYHYYYYYLLLLLLTKNLSDAMRQN